ncbi:hypothetical protein B0F90DRAFT_1722574 [Multifurca ochricompacta]|uniref:DNA mismatch repair protein PMS1 n=1 Tax=Multifurca ochricompacta TaxID=376703 RepID=A0AAD4QNF6_9AGAM|nr:hypothetical protein B0F90DRAFT_1722574 [Multifurca ochricompacta]
MSSELSSVPARVINPIDSHSVHRITSGQVVIDLQTAAKELLENSLDAGATNIEVRFKDYGLKSIEVIDNGSGIAPKDYESVALKHHTSKLTSFSDLTSVLTFGFRGEALSSLCALSESVSVTTATVAQAPMGTVLIFDSSGRLTSCSGKVARQRGTTVTINGLFVPLPVRRKELERHAKREFSKALHLLTAYALVPCTRENSGVILTVSNTPDGGKKTTQLRTDGATSIRASIGALWSPKQLENLVDLNLSFRVVPDKAVLRRREEGTVESHQIRVEGLVSKFAPGAGRAGTDRQFFFINGRPCAPVKVQKAINEIYRTFNASQSPFIIADFILPTDSCDINVSPDKRTILLHSENNLIEALKVALTESFDTTRSDFVLNATQVALARKEMKDSPIDDDRPVNDKERLPLFVPDDEDQDGDNDPVDAQGAPANESESNQVPTDGAEIPLPPKELHVHTSPPQKEPRLAQKRPRSPSPVPVSAIEARFSKRVAIPPSPSSAPAPAPVPVPVPARSTSTSQRLNGPGRTPARVEEILSTNTSITGRVVQTVLDTSGASWNLKLGQEGPPRKRPHLRGISEISSPKNARVNLRARLAGFARDGSQVVQDSRGEGAEDSPEEEEEEEEEEAELKGVEEKWNSKKLDSDGDDHKLGREEEPSMDVVDETMDVDFSVDENDILKPSHDTSRIVATADTASPVSSRTDEVDPISSNDDDVLPDSLSSSKKPLSSVAAATPSSSPLTKVYDIRTEVVRTVVGVIPSLVFDLDRTTNAWSAYLERRSTSASSSQPQQPTSRNLDLERADLEADDEIATAALARSLTKADFGSMDVVGQFNRGFIVARLRKTDTDGKSATDDLFIVDQHAADEKYNFETLQTTTRLESQRLFTPRVLELTAADELVAIENMGVLQQNGFEVTLEEDQPAGRRLRLVAQPVSKNTEFDMQDLEEILHLLRDRPAGTLVRSSKTRTMFAMRACRKSTMIGEPLNARQMTTIIRHMGTMDQPWNCPHGRPTMRHLSDVRALEREEVRAVDWALFVVPR